MYDDMLASLNGIPPATVKHIKALPFEQKLKLPAIECIVALYLAKEVHRAKKRIRN